MGRAAYGGADVCRAARGSGQDLINIPISLINVDFTYQWRLRTELSTEDVDKIL